MLLLNKTRQIKIFFLSKILTLLLFSFQFFSPFSFGQSFTLDGKITDAKSGSPIQG